MRELCHRNLGNSLGSCALFLALSFAMAARPALGSEIVAGAPHPMATPGRVAAIPLESKSRPVSSESQVASMAPLPYTARMQWWGEARFGLFIHWGPISLKGTEISWSRSPGPNGAPGGTVPAAEYDSLYKRFNPTNFDAKAWAELAKASGAKYVVFTTKHHDGFCEFDTKLTNYKITSLESPFRRDVVKELAEACTNSGLHFGAYYSQPDEHHPDYRGPRHQRYVSYFQGQVRELLSQYGLVDILWFDGLDGTAEDWGAPKLFDTIHKLQPQTLINNRCGLPGDFDTPEQRVGTFQLNRPWESCITLGRQWSWKPDDRIKTLKECIDMLVRCAGGDGNLLLNVGPSPDGSIEPRQAERLREIGRWLGRYGGALYGTRGGPWKPTAEFASTRKANTIFIHILGWDGDTLELPGLPEKIVASSLLTGGTAHVEQTAGGISVHVPRPFRQPLDTILSLTIQGSALDLAPIQTRGLSRLGGRAQASNVFQHLPEFSPEKALDGDSETRWATDATERSAWLQVDFPHPITFTQVALGEWAPGGTRVRAFQLQVWGGNAWRTFYQGGTIGAGWLMQFAPIKAQRVRLNILAATHGPTITEFDLK